MILASFIYPLTLLIFTDAEALPVFVGLLGLLLFAAALSRWGWLFPHSAGVNGGGSPRAFGGAPRVLCFGPRLPRTSADIRQLYCRYLAPSTHAEELLKE